MRVLGQVTYSWHPVDRHVHKPCTSPLRLWIPDWVAGSPLWTSRAVRPGGLGLRTVDVPAWLWTNAAEKMFAVASAALVGALADRPQVLMHPVDDHEEFEDHAVQAERQHQEDRVDDD